MKVICIDANDTNLEMGAMYDISDRNISGSFYFIDNKWYDKDRFVEDNRAEYYNPIEFIGKIIISHDEPWDYVEFSQNTCEGLLKGIEYLQIQPKSIYGVNIVINNDLKDGQVIFNDVFGYYTTINLYE